MNATQAAIIEAVNPIEAIKQFRQYMDEITPWRMKQATILGLLPTRYTICGTNVLCRGEVQWTPESRQAYDQIEEMINQITNSYYPKINP